MIKFRTIRPLLQFFAATLLLVLSACKTSNIGRSWADPYAQGRNFTKLAVVALTKQEVYRMQAEDELVASMYNGIASHTLLPGLNSLHDTATAIAALRAADCDGVVILRLKSGSVRIDPNAPAKPAASLGQDVDDYWVDPSAQEAHSFLPGQYFAVDVRVFDLKDDRMVYSGLVVEQDAKDVSDLVRMVRSDVLKDLRQRGLIAKQ